MAATRDTGISIGHCGCPHVHLIIIDRKGNELARVSFSPAKMREVVADIEANIACAEGKGGFQAAGHA
jgi:hypothetical protein